MTQPRYYNKMRRIIGQIKLQEKQEKQEREFQQRQRRYKELMGQSPEMQALEKELMAETDIEKQLEIVGRILAQEQKEKQIKEKENGTIKSI